ncbi:prolipoprotein diacylglyceryl transferase [Cohnella faecalis]|uniref:Phosphatidylglycerol--prolipoprotein diacylglyceryl transferase n=1 Tax=Cohnella faecalis TaxID=2315694 RepID=A0A398CN74_9BACL|nr:prolipoprotein diacylglyceryl transferase [Cohnella faecalis]RIE01031.1 prolipoprotein diacylglyceryl transferase [Cohnella faecalis]
MFPLELNPIAFSIGSLPVHWYGIILGSAALVGLLLAIQEGKRFGIVPDFFLDLLLYGVPSAIIGARLYYVLFKWNYYSKHPGEIIQIWNGGIAIYGALLGALICGIIYIRKKGYSVWRIIDVCAPSLLAGQMIGRWGNFVNQEAYGGPVEESFLRDKLHLPDFIVDQMNITGVYHHPTFLYESLWSLVGLALLFIVRRQRFLKAGELFLGYFIWYSIGRFYIEGLRTDSLAFEGPAWLASLVDGLWSPMKVVFDEGFLDPAYGNVRSSQLMAIFIIVVGIALIVIRRRTGQASERYVDPIVRRVNPAVATSETAAAGDAATDSNEKPGAIERENGEQEQAAEKTETSTDELKKENNDRSL